MARGEGHLLVVGGVPGGHHNPPARWIVLNLVYHVRQLIKPLPTVVRMHSVIGGAKVSPLEAVDGPQVPLLAVVEAHAVEEGARGVPVPDLDLLVREVLSVGVPLYKPYQLLGHTPPEHVLCSEYR